MSGQPERKPLINGKLQLFILLVLIANTLLIAVGLIFMLQRFSGGDSFLAYKQELARDLSDFNHRLAVDSGVADRPAVREALAEYNYEVDLAASSDELLRVIFDQGRRVQETVFQEADARLKEEVLSAVNEDSRIREVEEKAHIYSCN